MSILTIDLNDLTEEQLDELSRRLLGRYTKKAVDSVRTNDDKFHSMYSRLDHEQPSSDQVMAVLKKSNNRQKGINRAVTRLAKEDILEIDLNDLTEEQLDELSRGTLRSYVKKAKPDIARHNKLSHDHAIKSMRLVNKAEYLKTNKEKKPYWDKAYKHQRTGEDHDEKSYHRQVGIERAKKRLNREEWIHEGIGLTFRTLQEALIRLQESESNKCSDDGEGLDRLNKKAALKKFKSLKDKDIDNDSDSDKSDKYIHRRRGKITRSELDKDN